MIPTGSWASRYLVGSETIATPKKIPVRASVPRDPKNLTFRIALKISRMEINLGNKYDSMGNFIPDRNNEIRIPY
jgi:hypothetical protein